MAVRSPTAETVPTLEQARTAASVLGDQGASAVLLFGSVADGTAREGSDIDLVAVFDDIDYTERYPQRWRLEAQCRAAAGAPVDVHVTDWPEWTHRANHVSSSFEARVARVYMTLFKRDPAPGAVNWDKRIDMPESNTEEALERLAAVRQSLGRMSAACSPRASELRVRDDGRSEVDEIVRDERLRDVCADGSMVIETALKALSALHGSPSERTHNVARLLEQAGPLPDAVTEALAPLRANTMRPSRDDYDDVSSWRIGGTYPSDVPEATPARVEQLAGLITRAALAAAEAAVSRLLHEGADPEDERLAACQQRLRDTHEASEAADIASNVDGQTSA